MHFAKSLVGVLFLISFGAHSFAGQTVEVRPGILATSDLTSIPLPCSGRQVYLIGETHGLKEPKALFAEYLSKLHARAALRDVALEEDQVYDQAARDFVEWKSDSVPEQLCLRADVLGILRRFNEGRAQDEQIRVHLVDIDSPAGAIREHLLNVRTQIEGARAVPIPTDTHIAERGLQTVNQLARLTSDRTLQGELRTIRHSISALQQGLEIGTRLPKGNPLLEDREQAITANIQDLLQQAGCRVLLALYGHAHVSKTPIKVQVQVGLEAVASSPLACRLEQAGVKTFSLVCHALGGQMRWRGMAIELTSLGESIRLANGETLDQIVAAAPETAFFYIDTTRQKVRMPVLYPVDPTVDAFLFITRATPMESQCAK